LQVVQNADDNWIGRVQSRKWIIFGVFMVGIAVSGAEVIQA
jgi:hypothetical protein